MIDTMLEVLDAFYVEWRSSPGPRKIPAYTLRQMGPATLFADNGVVIIEFHEDRYILVA